MICEFRLPAIVNQMNGATLECLYAKPGDLLKVGSKLFDISVDLSSAFAQECPPVSFFRVVMRETAWLRKIDREPGGFASLGDVIAVLSTEPDEPIAAPNARVVRTTVAGIVHHDGMWTGRPA